MRLLYAILTSLLSAAVMSAAPPKAPPVVPERAPPVVVDDSGTVSTDANRYGYLLQMVLEGRSGVMIVGSHPYLEEYIHQEKFPSGFMGFSDGVYDCYRADGKAMMKLRDAPAPVREVRQDPFPSSTATTQGTTAPSVAVASTASAATARTVGIITLAPRATRGSTNCAVG
jgi:hypothetical protein